MLLLIIGLVVFLGVHSVRILAPDWRDAQREKLGEGPVERAFFSNLACRGRSTRLELRPRVAGCAGALRATGLDEAHHLGADVAGDDRAHGLRPAARPAQTGAEASAACRDEDLGLRASVGERRPGIGTAVRQFPWLGGARSHCRWSSATAGCGPTARPSSSSRPTSRARSVSPAAPRAGSRRACRWSAATSIRPGSA